MNDLLVTITITRTDGSLVMTYQGEADSNITWRSPDSSSDIISNTYTLSGFQYTPKLEELK